MIKLIRKESIELANPGSTHRGEHGFRDLVVSVSDDFTRFLIDDRLTQHTAQKIVIGNRNSRDIGLVQIAQMLSGNTLVMRNNHLAFSINNVEAHRLSLETLRNNGELSAALEQREAVKGKETGKNILNRVADCLEQNRARHLTTTVDAEIKNVLGVKFKIKPGATIRNYASREQQLARGMRLTLVMLKEDARRTMQLTHDHAFGTVHNERPLFRHQRHFAHIDVVLTNFLNGLRLSSLAIVDFQTDLRAQTARIGKTTELAFGNVEFRLSKLITGKTQTRETVMARDREN